MTEDGPPERTSSLTDEYRVVELETGSKLVLTPEDPLDALRSAASEEFKSASMAELRAPALEVSRTETNTDRE